MVGRGGAARDGAQERVISTHIGRVTVLAMSLVCACRKGEGARAAQLAEPSGTLLSRGDAADLRLTPDKKFALFLAEPQKPRLTGVPPMMVVGTLYASSIEEKKTRKLGDGVTNVPGGYLLSPDSRWAAFLMGYNASEQTGSLFVADLKSDNRPIELGKVVSYFLISPDSNWIAFVDGGVLKLGRLGLENAQSISGEVANAQFSPDSKWLMYRRKLTAGGTLFLTPVEGGRAWQLGAQVGDYLVAADSRSVAFAQRTSGGSPGYELHLSDIAALRHPDKRASGTELIAGKKLAARSGFFGFSPDGRWLGWVENKNRENTGTGELYVGAAGSAGRKIGTQVVDFSFAPDSSAIAFLDSYTDAARAGIMVETSLPDGKPRRLGNRVPNFTWGADGKYLAFLSRFLKPLYSVDLMLHLSGKESASKVHPGVFGYGFSPKNRFLFFRTNCIRDGRACDLYQVDLADPKAEPKKILEGIYTFKSSDDEGRLVVTYARVDVQAFDLAVYNLRSGQRRTLAREIQLPPLFATADGSKLIYLAGNKKHAGVYVADQLP